MRGFSPCSLSVAFLITVSLCMHLIVLSYYSHFILTLISNPPPLSSSALPCQLRPSRTLSIPENPDTRGDAFSFWINATLCPVIYAFATLWHLLSLAVCLPAPSPPSFKLASHSCSAYFIPAWSVLFYLLYYCSVQFVTFQSSVDLLRLFLRTFLFPSIHSFNLSIALLFPRLFLSPYQFSAISLPFFSFLPTLCDILSTIFFLHFLSFSWFWTYFIYGSTVFCASLSFVL